MSLSPNNKQLAFTYLLVGIIWSTTPLAISWSAIGVGAWFGVMARMALGLGFCLGILLLTKQKLVLDKTSVLNYFVASIGIWLTMVLIYLGVLHINSGFISVIFGFTPIVTAFFALIILKENSFSKYKIIGMLIAFLGLAFIYGQSIKHGELVVYGLFLVFLAMLVQALVSVLLKTINARASALATTTMALAFALPLLILFWLLFDGTWPTNIDDKTILAILYLGFFGSVVGFIGYYHIIKHLNINQVALLPLITPVFALILGYFFNNETLNNYELIGITLIMLGLFSHQFLDKKYARQNY